MLSLSRKMAFRPVSFVSVSLDINRDVWLSFVKRLGTTGGLIHLYAGKDREIIKEFGIVSVPSVVILNKDKYMIPSGNPYNIPDKLEETLLGILRDKDDSSPLSDSLSLIK